MTRLPLVLGELVAQAKRVWAQPALQWRQSQATQAELQKAQHEATTGAQFDRAGLKRSVWDAWRSGHARLECVECGLGRIVAFLPPRVHIPLEFWGRILQWFGRAPTGRPWLIFWFGATSPRRFPQPGQDLGPEHVNGGYTRPCSTDGVFIYRAEEATRVLIHELLHAACLDEQAWSIPMREAMIETWAELVLIALRSKGSAPAAAGLWSKQAHWIADTNTRAKHQNGMHDISDYAWRYLAGRVEMYERLGITLPAARSNHPSGSLRFTHPALGE